MNHESMRSSNSPVHFIFFLNGSGPLKAKTFLSGIPAHHGALLNEVASGPKNLLL
jgi:hypothetical protein